ncbi:hypothetical protein C900_00422 [Fulvivirga imtechensis AK7]|uniref:Uncharacterized protein n=1 Tax=Fulvivirga imtechensis AK7 TaxID=1237149 RepID=L8JHU5_9BACT|nr:hypothetical protein [Fulvivirga imtechensis]ELR68390.1 hypothetical protein C900_00422 [Fulvivirga imtechensis AK7]
MKMHYVALIVLFSAINPLIGQDNIVLSEGTLKVGGLSEDRFYFGLSEGDALVFNIEEVKGKKIREIEILEYPDNSKFYEFEEDQIKDKSITILNTGIYMLRLKNSALGARICRYKLTRIPGNPSKKFNSTVFWETKNDTTYYTIEEDYLISKDTAVINVVPHKVERVHSLMATNGLLNKTTIQVTLPNNTISWSYYLGVGEDAETIFSEAEEKAVKRKQQLKASSKLMNALAGLDFTGSTALASLALDGFAEFGAPNKADNIQYWFIPDYDNSQLFMNGNDFYQFDKGNGPLVYKRMEQPNSGTFYIGLFNDNVTEGIDVHIRISAVTVTENWGKQPVQRYNVKIWKEPYLKAY